MMEVTCSLHNSSLSLTTIPPELLLRVISFLPGPSAFLALSQSSSGLRQFVSLHASSICNEYILSRFALPSILFESQFQDGWLVPTDSVVWKEETAMLEMKRKLCAAHRRPEQPILQPGIGPLDISDYGFDFTLSPYASRPCRGIHNVGLRYPLSSPSPLYLAFLEEYGWDIEIFAERLKPSFTSNRVNERNERDPGVIWRISTYAIRPFLLKLDSIIPSDCGCGTVCDTSLPSPPMALVKTKNSLGHRLLSKSGLGKIFPFMVKEKPKGAQRLFGELAQEPEKSKLRTGSKCGLNKESISAVLLWSILSGSVGGLAPSSPVCNAMEAPLLSERKKPQTMNLMKDIRHKAKRIGKTVRLGLVASSERVVSFIHRGCFGKKRGFVLLK